MADYEFVTVWRIDAPLQAVWDEISHPQRWPTWWRGLEQVTELETGDEQGVGSRHRYTWKGVLPYRVFFEIQATRVETPTVLEGRVRGGLHGMGRWRLSSEGSGTVAKFDWQVSDPRAWMHRMAPLLRPLIKWNHDKVMAWGEQGLAKQIAGASARGSLQRTPERTHD